MKTEFTISIEGYVKALEGICEELKSRAADIIDAERYRTYAVDIRIHLVAGEIPTYDISKTYYPQKLEMIGECHDTRHDPNP